LLERPAGDAILLAPYIEPTTIPSLLSSAGAGVESGIETGYDHLGLETTPKVARRQTGNLLDPALEAKLGQVCSLLAQGTTNKADIILSVWGAKAGNSEKYRQAEGEYKQMMAYLARS